MNKSIVGAVWLMLASCALAEIDAVPIYQVINAQGDFIQVTLTHDIYRYSSQPDLHDLVVQDAEKNPLPYHVLTAKEQPQTSEPKFIATSLPFFPIAVDATPDTLRKLHTQAANLRGNNLQIVTSDKILDNKTPEFYLVDVSKLDHDITSIVVDWMANPGNEYLEVQLEGTHNLQDWDALASATLVQITQQRQSLKRDHIAVSLAKNDYQFLRLRVIRGADNLQITQINAEQKIGGPTPATVQQESWPVAGQPAKDQNTVYFATPHSKSQPVAAWEFMRDETTPVESLAVDFGNSVYADEVKVFSRRAENQQWQLQYQGIMFNAQVGSQWQKNDAIKLGRYFNHNSDSFWRLELNQSMRGKVNPQLILSWRPFELQFIGNSKPPFQLAITSNSESSLYRDQVFTQMTSATKPQWKQASLQALKVEVSSVKKPAPFNWKQWLFWGLLLVAVVVLLGFSLRLFKQIDSSAGR